MGAADVVALEVVGGVAALEVPKIGSPVKAR
jgi:hypothetical protein